MGEGLCRSHYYPAQYPGGGPQLVVHRLGSVHRDAHGLHARGLEALGHHGRQPASPGLHAHPHPALGERDGLAEGLADGERLGLSEGDADGESVGPARALSIRVVPDALTVVV